MSRSDANALQKQLDSDFPSSWAPKVLGVRALLGKRAYLDDPNGGIPLWSQNLDLLYSGKSDEKMVALPGRALHSELMISLGSISSYFNDSADLEGNPVTAAITFVHSQEGGGEVLLPFPLGQSRAKNPIIFLIRRRWQIVI